MRFDDTKFTITPYPERKHPDGIEALYIEMQYEFLFRSIIHADGAVSCYLPVFNLYFYAKDKKEIENMARIVFNAHMEGWIRDEGFSSFIRHLKVIGFEPNNGILDWNKLKKREIKNAIIFKPRKAKVGIPEDFGGEGVEQHKVVQKYEMAY